jgi:Leucine rich repeat variant
MRRSDLVSHHRAGKPRRTSQIVFGERQHLLHVLDSIEQSDLPRIRFETERRAIQRLIHDRTEELNRINPDWDVKVSAALKVDARPEALDELHRSSPEEDYYLLRLISEHPRTGARTLRKLAAHPYAAIRENVARHPNADGPTLERLSRDRSQPLWYLVAFNSNAPASLRERLHKRLQKLGEQAVAL